MEKRPTDLVCLETATCFCMSMFVSVYVTMFSAVSAHISMFLLVFDSTRGGVP